MNKEKAVIDIIQKSSKNLPQKVLAKDSLLKSIPFDIAKNAGLSNEEYDALKPYIEEFQLNNPQKLIKWVVDLHFACFESVNEGISNIRKDAVKDVIANCKSAKMLMKYAFDNPKEKENLLTTCLSKLSDASTFLQEKILTFSDEINKIDERPAYLFFIRAKLDQAKVTNNVQMIKLALAAFFESITLLVIIGNEKKTDITVFIQNAKDFIDMLKEKKYTSLLYAYDENHDEIFWNSSEMISSINKIESLSDDLSKYLEAEKETEIDFENDIIFN